VIDAHKWPGHPGPVYAGMSPCATTWACRFEGKLFCTAGSNACANTSNEVVIQTLSRVQTAKEKLWEVNITIAINSHLVEERELCLARENYGSGLHKSVPGKWLAGCRKVSRSTAISMNTRWPE
jgi:hypothetical protein